MCPSVILFMLKKPFSTHLKFHEVHLKLKTKNPSHKSIFCFLYDKLHILQALSKIIQKNLFSFKVLYILQKSSLFDKLFFLQASFEKYFSKKFWFFSLLWEIAWLAGDWAFITRNQIWNLHKFGSFLWSFRQNSWGLL